MMDEIRDPIKEETKDRMMEGVTRGHAIEETKDRMMEEVTRGPMNATNGTLKEEARGHMKVEMQGHTKEEEETGDRMKETRGHTMEGHDPSRLRVRRGVGCMSRMYEGDNRGPAARQDSVPRGYGYGSL